MEADQESFRLHRGLRMTSGTLDAELLQAAIAKARIPSWLEEWMALLKLVSLRMTALVENGYEGPSLFYPETFCPNAE